MLAQKTNVKVKNAFGRQGLFRLVTIRWVPGADKIRSVCLFGSGTTQHPGLNVQLAGLTIWSEYYIHTEQNYSLRTADGQGFPAWLKRWTYTIYYEAI